LLTIACFLSFTETFNLYKNEFSSTLPDEISQLPKLAHLFVGYNSLTGELPEGMAGMTTLKSLGLSYNRLKGEDLFERFVVTWPALQVLTLDSTLFTGGIPPSIGDLTNLQVLSIDKTLFEGNLPTELNLLTGLTKLDLYGSDLSGEIPDLGELTRLGTLLHRPFSYA
jgi:Leucine-rich repeat (LRR) protein